MSPHVFAAETLERFKAVDSWICNSLLPSDPALESALKANQASQLDAIDVAPNQGKLLYLLAKVNRAKRILEVGTLGGYSAIWMAKALPSDGELITCELEPDHAKVAQTNIKNAGFQNIVEIKVGPAMETLSKMSKRKKETGIFDLVFIDADKENNVGYFNYALEFSRVGSVIVVDNVVRRGRVVDADSKGDPAVEGVKRLFEVMGKLEREGRIESTAVQTVGEKGWDGFAISTVVA